MSNPPWFASLISYNAKDYQDLREGKVDYFGKENRKPPTLRALNGFEWPLIEPKVVKVKDKDE